jgi:hypothetical protein
VCGGESGAHKLNICLIVKPWASRIASVQPSLLAASNSSARRRSGLGRLRTRDMTHNGHPTHLSRDYPSGMKAKTHFAFRIDAWDTTGDNVVEQLAGLECALSGRR